MRIQNKLKKITIVILTLNRPTLLVKTVKYFSNHGIKCIVADGSTNNNVADLTFFSNTCKHLHIPDDDHFKAMGNYAQRMKMALDLIESEYAMLCPDDEFRSISSIAKAVDILDKDHDLVGVYGSAINYRVLKNEKVIFSPDYQSLGSTDLAEDHEFKRIITHFRNYQPAAHFSVLRSSRLRSAYLFSLSIEPPVFAIAELMMEFYIVLTGRLHFLNDILIIRANLDNKIPRKTPVVCFKDWWDSDSSETEKQILYCRLYEMIKNNDILLANNSKLLLNLAMEVYLRRNDVAIHGYKFTLFSYFKKSVKSSMPHWVVSIVRHFLKSFRRNMIVSFKGSSFRVGSQNDLLISFRSCEVNEIESAILDSNHSPANSLSVYKT